jgi:hypothetical protein
MLITPGYWYFAYICCLDWSRVPLSNAYTHHVGRRVGGFQGFIRRQTESWVRQGRQYNTRPVDILASRELQTGCRLRYRCKSIYVMFMGYYNILIQFEHRPSWRLFRRMKGMTRRKDHERRD